MPINHKDLRPYRVCIQLVYAFVTQSSNHNFKHAGIVPYILVNFTKHENSIITTKKSLCPFQTLY